MNTLIIIGWLGDRLAYLNVPREEAIARFRKSEGFEPEEDISHLVTELAFEDEFAVYDAWRKT